MVYQQNHHSKILVIYYILLRSKEVDSKLMGKVLQEEDYSRYVSFKGTDSKLRLGMLHSNDMVNVEGKFEVLNKVNVNDMISIRKKILVKRFFIRCKSDRNKAICSSRTGMR